MTPDRFTYTLDREEFIAGLEAVVEGILAEDKTPYRQIDFWGLQVVLVIAGGAAATLIWFARPDLWWAAPHSIVVTLAMQCGALAIVFYYLARGQRAQLGTTFRARRHQNVTALFDEVGAHYFGHEHKQSWHWPLLRRLHNLPTVYALEFVGSDMLVVPKRVFPSPQREADWAARVAARLPTGAKNG